ncbi:uncharacterized protein LOC123322965 [Coccinella septempunctata]|uniref:uncharacterized protein LOC123322965 n=1 Tax=Coccinella septempunctata TaxID=41139 RepID=UPI001D07E57B|nr:uncharacterized protein LOC123322965 [Coccinella septempunctata]
MTTCSPNTLLRAPHFHMHSVPYLHPDENFDYSLYFHRYNTNHLSSASLDYNTIFLIHTKLKIWVIITIIKQENGRSLYTGKTHMELTITQITLKSLYYVFHFMWTIKVKDLLWLIDFSIMCSGSHEFNDFLLNINENHERNIRKGTENSKKYIGIKSQYDWDYIEMTQSPSENGIEE